MEKQEETIQPVEEETLEQVSGGFAAPTSREEKTNPEASIHRTTANTRFIG